MIKKLYAYNKKNKEQKILNYRPEIDGLRAIAVVSVVLYHAQIKIFGKNWFEGGLIGVDIFFVISGYLITRIILTELTETNKFSLIKFYEKRARRILPMLFLVIAASIPFAWQKLLPIDLIDFAKSALTAIGFCSNFFFYYSTTEYGADSSLLKPLLHTWSLGVEEQFYIVFPILILLIWKFAKASLLTSIVTMLLMSILFADVMEGIYSELNFFLPFSRFWELLVGSILAFFELKYRRIKNLLLMQNLPILGLFLILHGILSFDSNTPHPSFYTLMPIVGVALIIGFSSTNDFVGKLLSSKPIVGVGLISYSFYLWHFPIFAFNRLGSSNPSTYDKLEWIILAFVLSIVSYHFIEKPFRNRNFIKNKLFFSFVIIALLALAFVNYNFVSNEGYKDRLPPILSKQNLDEKVWQNFKKNGENCYNRVSGFCREENGRELTHIYAFSDSHFSSMSKQLVSSIGKKFNYTEVNNGSCPFVLNLNRYKTDGNLDSRCSSNFQNLRYEIIDKKPSIILIGGRFPLYLSSQYFDNKEGGVESGEVNFFKSINDLTFEEEFKKTIRLLISNGHQLVLVYPIPEVGVNVPKYIFNTTKGKTISRIEFKPLTTSYNVYKERSLLTFDLFDSIQSSKIHRVYPHELFCDTQIKDRCVTHNNDDVFYADDDHPSAKGSEMIVELIMKQIKKAEANIRNNLIIPK